MILIDEYSTGIDAATKRHMWDTFRKVAAGKAVVITTRERRRVEPCTCSCVFQIRWKRPQPSRTRSRSSRASCSVRPRLASPRALALIRGPAVGTSRELESRFAIYEVHMTCRTPEERARAQALMAGVPGARLADDVATRFEVPLTDDLSLAALFGILSSRGASEFTVERVSLESVFLKVIRANNVKELEDDHAHGGGRSRWLC